FRPAILDCDILAFKIASLTKSLAKRGKVGGRFRWRPRAQEPDHRQRQLLRTRRDRPRRRAAEQRNEIAPLHLRDHSITSSARCWRNQGTSRPSAFAVLRLITSSNLLGRSIGSSPALAPLRIRST